MPATVSHRVNRYPPWAKPWGLSFSSPMGARASQYPGSSLVTSMPLKCM